MPLPLVVATISRCAPVTCVAALKSASDAVEPILRHKSSRYLDAGHSARRQMWDSQTWWQNE